VSDGSEPGRRRAPNPSAAGGVGHKRRRSVKDVSPYAVLAGHPDEPLWWRRPLASLLLATGALTLAAITGGAGGTALIVVGVIVGLPAVFQGLLLTAVAALENRYGTSDAQRHAARRVLMVARVVAAASTAIGIYLYAEHPGVGSYQASLLLTLPLLLVALGRLHRWLPPQVQWGTATVLGASGCAGYLIFGGAQWWNWGQFALYPLVLLFAHRVVMSGGGPGRWYGGDQDGPWGPP
jgi:hypothetical protein